MPGIILSSYLLILLGFVLIVGGLFARYRGRRKSRYLLVAGGILLLLGLAGLSYFISAFG